MRTLQRGPTFFGTFSVFGHSKSAWCEGLLVEIRMHISLAIEWLLDSEDPVPGGELPRGKYVGLSKPSSDKLFNLKT